MAKRRSHGEDSAYQRKSDGRVVVKLRIGQDADGKTLQGVPPKTVQQRPGHSSIQVTMDTYGHLMPGADREVADGRADGLGLRNLSA